MARSLTPDRERATIARRAVHDRRMLVAGSLRPAGAGASSPARIAGLRWLRPHGADAAEDPAICRARVARPPAVVCLVAVRRAAGRPAACWPRWHRRRTGRLVRQPSTAPARWSSAAAMSCCRCCRRRWCARAGDARDAFLAGYGAAQAVPGPLFTFAAYLGAVHAGPAPNGVTGAAIALVAIFLPAVLLLVGGLPFWDQLRARARRAGAMRGVNAAVVGILGGRALRSGVHARGDVARHDGHCGGLVRGPGGLGRPGLGGRDRGGPSGICHSLKRPTAALPLPAAIRTMDRPQRSRRPRH